MQEIKLNPPAPSGHPPLTRGALAETTIRLPDETVDYLQRLDYEIAGLQVLHTHALKAGTPLEQRMEIKREFQERYAEYQLAKNEMWAEFAPRFPNMKRWWVDFQTGELHVVSESSCVGRDDPGAPSDTTRANGNTAGRVVQPYTERDGANA